MTTATNSDAANLKSLGIRWLVLSCLSAAAVFGGFVVLRIAWTTPAAQQWALVAGLVLASQFAYHYPHLRLNHHPDQTAIMPTFGLGTAASLTRLVCIAFLAGFLGLPRPPGAWGWMPFAVYLFAGVNDLLDGYLARRFDHETELGARLDLDLDGRALLVVSLLAFQYEVVPWWFLSAGVARYFFILGLWWRQWQGLPNESLKPNPARRPLAGAQMGFTTATLAPILGPPLTTLAAALFIPPFIGNFLYDWLQVSSKMPSFLKPSQSLKRFWTLLSYWIPPLLRAAAVAALILRLGQVTALPFFIIMDWISIPFLAFGVLGRLAALVALIATGFRFAFYPLLPIDITLVVLLSTLFFLGSGAWSIWSPEIAWANRHLGSSKG